MSPSASPDLSDLRQAMFDAVRRYTRAYIAYWKAQQGSDPAIEVCCAAHIALDDALTALLEALPTDDPDRPWVDQYRTMLRRADHAHVERNPYDPP